MIKKLDDYEAVVVDGVWCIAWRQEGRPVQYLSKKNGLPHPLKGRRAKKKVEMTAITNDALELMFQLASSHSSAPPEAPL